MQNDNVIIWQKWIDPFGRDENPEQEEFGNFVEDDAGVEEDPKDESFLAGHSINME